MGPKFDEVTMKSIRSKTTFLQLRFIKTLFFACIQNQPCLENDVLKKAVYSHVIYHSA